MPVLVGVLLLLCAPRAASAAELSIVADLIDRFDEKLADNCMAASVRGLISSGRATYRALYQHPQNAQDATITYTLTLPDKPADARLALIGWACVLDQVREQDKDGRCNGTRFVVRVDGKDRLARDQKPGNWVPVCLPLDDCAGKTVKLQLATNAIQSNTNYDWAYWGDLRVMILPDGVEVGAEPVSGLAGLLIAPVQAAGAKGVKLTLQPVSESGAKAGEGTDVWLEPAPGCATTVAGFDLSKGVTPGAAKVRITAADGKPPAGLRLLGYRAKVELSRPVPGRAIITEGDDLPICVTLKNVGLGPWVPSSGRLWIKLAPGERAACPLRPDWQVKDDPTAAVIDKLDRVLPHGGEMVVTRRFKAPQAGRATAYCAFEQVVSERRRAIRLRSATFDVDKALPGLTGPGGQLAKDGNSVAENRLCRVVFVKRSDEARTGYFQLRVGEGWRTLAVCPRLVDVYTGQVARDPKGKTPRPDRVCEGPPAFGESRCSVKRVKTDVVKGRVTFSIWLETPDGRPLEATLSYGLHDKDAIVDVTGKLRAPKGAHLRRFCPISLRVADGLPTKDRGQALLPGLEYLDDGEPSSSTRDAHPPVNNRLMPDPLKITVPMMMVSAQTGMVTLMWNPTQKWNGVGYGPCAAFASPNLVHRQENHLMEVFVPAFPDYVNENERIAAASYEMKPGETVSVSARIVLREKGDAVAAMKDYFKLNPPPKPAPKQYPLQKLYEISRHGFLKTVWYPDKQKSSHCVGWSPANAPQFGVLLTIDSILTDDPAARKASRERTRLIWANTLRDAGPAGLCSGACCHIMREEAPFYTGHVEAMVKAMLADAAGQIRGRNADGVWGFQPPNDARHRALGPRGYASQGIVARGALGLLRKARVTGSADALAAGLKALDYHDRFHVPHGAQGWECPIYEPDVLGTAYAVGAYVDAYEMTGKKQYLDRAIYWAWTGMAFQYVWQAPDREQWMRYASIPVFGTTFFTHSWLGNPVQWCGLVYAYFLQRLAPHDKTFPWKQVAEGMTVSGEWLQFGDERPDLKGSYPDGLYGRLTKRCPAMINPEDIILNRLAVEGHDPRVKTRYVRRNGAATIHVTSCAKLGDAKIDGKTLTVPMRFYKDHHSAALLANCPAPVSVAFSGRVLPSVPGIPESPEGWKYLPETRHLIVRAKHAADAPATLTITFK